jgi:hypothetical protein
MVGSINAAYPQSASRVVIMVGRDRLMDLKPAGLPANR